MKTSKFLLSVFFVSLCATLFFFNSCSDDEYEPYNEVLVIASETNVNNEGIVYWVKRNGSSTWEMMYTKIANFNHEEGYEYTVKVSVEKNKNPGPDQSSHKYTLVKIITKEKKNSELPIYTTDISLKKSKDEVAPFTSTFIWSVA